MEKERSHEMEVDKEKEKKNEEKSIEKKGRIIGLMASIPSFIYFIIWVMHYGNSK